MKLNILATTALFCIPFWGMSQQAGKICLENNRLYAVLPGEGIAIYNVANPQRPIETRFVYYPGVIDIVTRGELIYCSRYADLALLKVPFDATKEVEEIAIRPQVFPSRVQRTIDLLSFTSYQAYRVHLSKYRNGSVAPPAASIGSMSCITLSGNAIYAVDGCTMITLDASPTSPGLFDEMNRQTLPHGPLETIWSDAGKRIYIGSQMGLYLIDNSDRFQPYLIGSYRHERSCDPVVVQGDWAYSTQRDGSDCRGAVNQLDIVNIKNPAAPHSVHKIALTNPHGLAIDRGILLVCDGGDGLRIFDLRNNAAPKEIAHKKGFMAFDVLYNSSSKIAYVSEPRQIKLFSLSSPESPALLATIVLPWIGA